jgi:hypothetical protein
MESLASGSTGQRETGGARRVDGRRQSSVGGTSRVTGDSQARFSEGLGVQFPGSTRQVRYSEGVAIHTDSEPKNRWPTPSRRQRTAKKGTEHQTNRKHHGVDAKRPTTSFLAIKTYDQCCAAAQHQCSADTLQEAKEQHRAKLGE